MWKANGTTIEMTEGDFGIELPITISGVTIAASDSVMLTVKKFADGTSVIEKTFTSVQNNQINLVFTEEDSALLKVGNYTYILDWYRLGNFMSNIIPKGTLRVVDKA